MRKNPKEWQQYKNVAGIYKITCTGNNKFYIGSSVNIFNRWNVHISELRAGSHRSEYLQRSYNKYGEESLRFDVLQIIETTDTELLVTVEFYYIDKLKPEFNTLGPTFFERTEQWKNKISKTTKELYTKHNYVNPRKGVGKRYKIFDSYGVFIKDNLTAPEVCDELGLKSYHTLNTQLRKGNGVAIIKRNYIVCNNEMNCKDIFNVIKQFPSMLYSIKACDLNGTIVKVKQSATKKLPYTCLQIKERILMSENMYFKYNDTIFTFTFLCPYIKKFILENT